MVIPCFNFQIIILNFLIFKKKIISNSIVFSYLSQTIQLKKNLDHRNISNENHHIEQ